MSLDEFRQADPGTMKPALAALWWMEKGDWEKAHKLAQDDQSPEGSWVHAHLHRVEGDLRNAGYWYRRAGRDAASGELASERHAIIADLWP